MSNFIRRLPETDVCQIYIYTIRRLWLGLIRADDRRETKRETPVDFPTREHFYKNKLKILLTFFRNYVHISYKIQNFITYIDIKNENFL